MKATVIGGMLALLLLLATGCASTNPETFVIKFIGGAIMLLLGLVLLIMPSLVTG